MGQKESHVMASPIEMARMFVKPGIKKIRPYPAEEDEMVDELKRAMEPRAVGPAEGDLLYNVERNYPTPNRAAKGNLSQTVSSNKENFIPTRAEVARSLLGQGPRRSLVGERRR